MSLVRGLIDIAQQAFGLDADTVTVVLPVAVLLVACAVLLVSFYLLRSLRKMPPFDGSPPG